MILAIVEGGQNNMITKAKMGVLWLLWLLLWPLLLWVSYNVYYINIEGQLLDILIFAVFMSIVAMFPLKINNKQIFFINGISIAVFLLYGLFIEIVLSQLTILIVIMKTGFNKNESYRIPLNMLSFILVSFIGAEVYFYLGGRHGVINYYNVTEVLAVIGYATAIFIANQLLNKLIDIYLFNRKVKLIDKVLKWELFSLLLILPIGFVLFMLYEEIGWIGIFYLGIPFIFISVILKLLYSYQELNLYLKKTGEIGRKLTKRFKLSEVYDVFMTEIIELFPVDYIFKYKVTNEEKLELIRYYDSDYRVARPFKFLDKNEGVSGKVFATGKPLIYDLLRDEKLLNHVKFPPQTRSMISLPIEYNNRMIGIITIASKQQGYFDKTHYKILDIITTYLGIATENAKNFERTKEKGQKDGLTHLYNYHYFDEYIENVDSKTTYSLLLLDLDHFKSINDIYGHEAGNEILCEVARRIQHLIGNDGLIARYGGEEFAVLMSQTDTKRAVAIGEQLRIVIAENPFIVYNHITDLPGPVHINATVSIGISTFPDHCEDIKDLVRVADRAMYIGAKRTGRNKVAVSELN